MINKVLVYIYKSIYNIIILFILNFCISVEKLLSFLEIIICCNF